jgi:hypothetical protein
MAQRVVERTVDNGGSPRTSGLIIREPGGVDNCLLSRFPGV